MVIISSRSSYRFDREMVKKVIEDTLGKHGVSQEIEVGLSVVGGQKMKKLHKKYMETDEVTDVLSFPTYEKKLLGDIVVCYPVAVKQALENNRTIDKEMAFLVEHSCKHLLGIHHE